MSKIIMIASGKHIAQHGLALKNQLETSDELDIVVAHMEDAVQLARQYVHTDVDIIIARGTTARMLKEARIPIPVVEIPVADTEIIETIKLAQEKSKKQSPVIGFIGLEDVIITIRSFLEILNLKIYLYEVATTQDIKDKIKQAQEDGVDILIGGTLSCNLIQAAGLKSVLFKSSYTSVRKAYQMAKEMQFAVNLEKKKAEEQTTIFNSVSEAIISVDDKNSLSRLNKLAEQLFERDSNKIKGNHSSEILGAAQVNLVEKVLLSGEKIVGQIMEIRNKKYALNVIPIIVEKIITGAIITLQGITELQKIETAVRKGLYQKGNVAHYSFTDIKGISAEIQETINSARSFAKLHSNILIIGETGTGKELFAQSIHQESIRKDGPFVAVNCGAIPSNLVESELFGYVDGAFTGAKKGGKPGLFELAHGGTIFLDEISEMDLLGQVILLRALQERQIRRVGGDSIIPVDVRVIAACNTNLHAMVQQNKFRKDLYYRLSVLVVSVPALRHRQNDIAYLSNFFINYYNRQFGKNILLADDALQEFEQVNWDGNIRQLKNFCERLVALADKAIVDSIYVKKQLTNSFWGEPAPAENEGLISQITESAPAMFMVNNKLVSYLQLKDLMIQYKGNRKIISEKLGISRTTLWKYLKKANL